MDKQCDVCEGSGYLWGEECNYCHVGTKVTECQICGKEAETPSGRYTMCDNCWTCFVEYKRKKRTPVRSPCGPCNGTGYIWDGTCPYCHGAGLTS